MIKNPFRQALRDYQLWLMIIPAIAVIFIFNYIPMYGVQLAFRDFNFSKGLLGGKWVGLKYFEIFFKSPMFLTTLRNTFVIAVTSIAFGFPAPILMALVFNQIRLHKTKRFMQTVVYIPYFISTVVLVALISILCSPNNGVISHFLKALGLIEQNVNLVGSASTFVPLYVISGIWQACGWNSIIYFAALSGVDTQLYDAAKIDGANRLRIIWHIELTALLPTIVILLILSTGNILTVGFEKVFLMQNSLNITVSEVISTYTYKIGLRSNQFSLGSAIGLFNTAVNFAFLMLTNFIAKRTSDISLW
ncbi:sugar ABC transporter permease [Spirochaetia bacterium]|nr:sugar ABC transporter permease [Spirochaetia bacterium]